MTASAQERALRVLGAVRGPAGLPEARLLEYNRPGGQFHAKARPSTIRKFSTIGPDSHTAFAALAEPSRISPTLSICFRFHRARRPIIRVVHLVPITPLARDERPLCGCGSQGIWCAPCGSPALPAATAVGSPNYGERSLSRDIESQVPLDSFCPRILCRLVVFCKW